MIYSEKLKDPRWQKKRLIILQRDDFKCVLCGDDKTTLHVHHSMYCGSPWRTPNEYLHTLCVHCHEIVGEVLEMEKALCPDGLFTVSDIRDAMIDGPLPDEPWKQRVVVHSRLLKLHTSRSQPVATHG